MRKMDEDSRYYIPNFQIFVEFSTGITLLKLHFLMSSPYRFWNLKKVDGKKDKTISVTGSGGPLGCETSRLPHFLQTVSSLMAVRLSALSTGRSLPPERFLVLIYVRD
jgi:hypothetical protein